VTLCDRSYGGCLRTRSDLKKGHLWAIGEGLFGGLKTLYHLEKLGSKEAWSQDGRLAKDSRSLARPLFLVMNTLYCNPRDASKVGVTEARKLAS